jgi:Protein kinase domain
MESRREPQAGSKERGAESREAARNEPLEPSASPSASAAGSGAVSGTQPAGSAGRDGQARARTGDRSPRTAANKHVILFLAANPVGTNRLALDREARSIHAELKRSGYGDRFEFVTRWAAEPLDLLRELRELKPTVMHFSGHGGHVVSSAASTDGRDVVAESGTSSSAEIGLYFQDAIGGAHAVSPEAIAQTVGAAGVSVKLVVLNACFTEPIAEALMAHVDCIVGMSGSIRDDAARNFSIGFYGGLGEHESIATAFEHGRAAISLAGLPDAARLRLQVRDGVDASQLILAATGPAVRRVPPGPHPGMTPCEPDDAPRFHSRDAAFALAWCSGVRVPLEDLECGTFPHRDDFEELIVGNYRLGNRLGYGGSGMVFRAHHRTLRNEVALKLFYPVSGAARELLGAVERSARGLKSLGHRGIVQLLDLGHLEVADTVAVYVVMEFIEGEPLNRWSDCLGHGINATRARIASAIEIASALQAAHASSYLDNLGFAQTGVLHGDVKPSNILVRQRNAQPVLLDFMMPDLQRLIAVAPGRATSVRELGRLASTDDFGTYGYMPPEQEDNGIVLPASDVYSLGRTLNEIFGETLNEIFADKTPADGTQFSSMQEAPLGCAPESDLGDLLSSMTRPHPSDRPTMMAVVERLRALLDLPW